jgi:hypothetical protein
MNLSSTRGEQLITKATNRKSFVCALMYLLKTKIARFAGKKGGGAAKPQNTFLLFSVPLFLFRARVLSVFSLYLCSFFS